ncbi:hypothetical protein CcI49_03325 [Frankia sp. CcI49]|nr:hypothetical protein CcI49_03325 [Frankia sp. CcI49]
MERMKAEHDSLIEQRRERTRRAGSEASHRYRQAWAEIGVRVAGIGLGFAAVINLSALAKHYSDIGQAGYGVLIVTSGAVAIAGIFVLGKFVGRMPRVPINTQSPPPVDPSANGGGPAAP